MKNILLICTAGMSTSIIVKKMEEVAKEKSIDVNIWAVGDALAKDNIGKADVIMLGPQVKFLLDNIKAMAKDKPVVVIEMKDYGMMNGSAILEHALNQLK